MNIIIYNIYYISFIYKLKLIHSDQISGYCTESSRHRIVTHEWPPPIQSPPVKNVAYFVWGPYAHTSCMAPMHFVCKRHSPYILYGPMLFV